MAIRHFGIFYGAVGTPAVQDPYFSNVELLTPFNESDGSTTATDYSKNSYSLSFQGDAETDSGQQLFGENTLLCDGTGDYVNVLGSEGLDLSNEDFTIEGFFRTTDLTALVSKGIITKADNVAQGYAPFRIEHYQGDLYAVIVDSSGTGVIMSSGDGLIPISVNTWYHVALERYGQSFKLYLDGVSGVSVTSANALYDNSSQPIQIGTMGSNSSANSFNGNLANIRITKGVARYKENFTPPDAPFPTS